MGWFAPPAESTPYPTSEARTDDVRRLAIKALLGREITNGLDLLARDGEGVTVDDPRLEDWHRRVLLLVAESLGTGEMSRMQFWGEHSRADLIKARLEQLANLIPRVDTILLVPEFDPWA
jgi:hypothetical protein